MDLRKIVAPYAQNSRLFAKFVPVKLNETGTMNMCRMNSEQGGWPPPVERSDRKASRGLKRGRRSVRKASRGLKRGRRSVR